jgi:putative inorganic carbon (HCO3(-)) transporter
LYGPPEAKKALAAHNVFLQALTELGWIGFVLFLIFVGGGMGGAFAAARDPDVGWLARGIAGSLAGYFVCCCFAGFLASPHLYVLVAVGAAAQRLASLPKRATEPVVEESTGPADWAITG